MDALARRTVRGTVEEMIDGKTRMECVSKLTENMPKLRKRLGMTQTALAEAIEVNLSTINGLEKGRRHMAWPMFLALEMFFFCQPATKQWVSDNLHPERLLRIDT